MQSFKLYFYTRGFAPEYLFVNTETISKFGSGLFLLVQVVLLLDFVHSWNDKWVGYDEQFWLVLSYVLHSYFCCSRHPPHSNISSYSWLAVLCYRYVALLVVSLVCYVATFAFNGVLFHFFTPSGQDCGLNTFFIVMTLILIFGFAVVTLHPSVGSVYLFPLLLHILPCS